MKESLHLNERDWQALSEYLDGQLSERDNTRLEKRLNEQSDLRTGLEELRQTRAMLRSVRKQPAPRNFTLSPAMVQQAKKPNPLLRFIPVFNFASAASALAVVALLAAGLLPGVAPAAAPAPAAEQVSAFEAPASDVAQPQMVIQWGSPGGTGGGAVDMAMGKGGGADDSGSYTGPGFVIPPQAVEGMSEEPALAKSFEEPSAGAQETALPEVSAAPEVLSAPAATPMPELRQMVDAQVEPLTGSGPILGAVSPEEAQATNDSVAMSYPVADTQNLAKESRWWLLPAAALSVLAIGFALAGQILRRKSRA